MESIPDLRNRPVPEVRDPPVLDVRDLSVTITLPATTVCAAGHVDLHVAAGETLGLVGESGSGKSMTALAVMGLLPPGGAVTGVSVLFGVHDLTALRADQLRQLRGNDLAMVFQDPLTSLDPTKTVGYQVAEPVRQHRGASKPAARERALEVLALVGMPRPRDIAASYPHQLSGGLRQRVMIAMALGCEPTLLISDEPTTALDVTIQAQILDLLAGLRERLGMAMLLITHDLGVIAGHADRVSVMYAGRIVETAGTGPLFAGMRPPYSQAVLASTPRLSQDPAQPLPAIGGLPPDLASPPPGCRFAPRCRYATDQCRAEEPPLSGPARSGPAQAGVEGKHRFACWHPVDGPRPAAPVLAANGAAPSPPASPGPVLAGEPLIDVKNVIKEYPVTSGAVLRRKVAAVHAASGVSFAVPAGSTFGLVGESGCGKTTVGKMIVALERPDSGDVRLAGVDLATLHGSALRRQRRDLQLMSQDPLASLDPRMRVGSILAEPLAVQHAGHRPDRRRRVLELLGEVGLPVSEVERYPHEFSGGQRQPVGLAP